MKKGFAWDIVSSFAFFCIVFIPFPFNLVKLQLQVTDFFFGRLIGFVAHTFFNITLKDTRVYSDTVSMYVLVLLLFILSLLAAFLLSGIKKWAVYRTRGLRFVNGLACYYLALLLLKYGVDKVFKNQFYTPEPNTLYTPLGRMDKDLLYWSSMGTSYIYSFFLGSLEILASVCILIKRTRLMGLLFSFVILVNVVAVNFGFDISVKLFSLFLLFLTVYLLVPFLPALYHFFLRDGTGRNQEIRKGLPKTFGYIFFKWLLVCFICLEAIYPFLITGNFNGDLAGRPWLHGAYEIRQVTAGGDTIPLANSPVKRFFIHRKGYIIFQDQQDQVQDYKLAYEEKGSAFILTDYSLHRVRLPYTYRARDSVLVLSYPVGGKEYLLTGKGLDWRKLPALQKGFHWTFD